MTIYIGRNIVYTAPNEKEYPGIICSYGKTSYQSYNIIYFDMGKDSGEDIICRAYMVRQSDGPGALSFVP